MQNMRYHEFDWLRVGAFALLIFYHTGMYYVADWGWHYKSLHQSESLQFLMLWSNQWRMSLLFIISGFAVATMLQRKKPSRFFIQQPTRLIVPLIFGMLVVVVPQVYIEAVHIGLIERGYSYLSFWGAYLDQDSPLFEGHKTIDDLHITWNHLWYLPYLLTYSLAAGAAYYAMGSRLRAWLRLVLSQFPAWITVVLLPVILLSLNSRWLYEDYPPTNALFGDYFNHGRYGIAFLFGILIYSQPRCWQWIKHLRHATLPMAILTYGFIAFSFSGGELGEGALVEWLTTGLWALNKWLWLLTILGWAQVIFCRENRAVQYLNRGVYCYYILHQTCILVFAFWLRPYDLPPGIEATALILLTLASCAFAYELLRRIPGAAFVFGIPRKKNESSNRLLTPQTTV
ncbi:conserved hypothetical protein [Teredinibacter turnerae T7901]|uniref:Acyltransferase 3 domain-containing protein n=1 Tax=Teredinibacter turnerae (strain ATCC 39867 / T7901) TaxID=377629 RepID=C5BN27_TERTT|nr:acyltransferase family protein [Teredinibacter turnerae]ACR12615.1 conserved hypothetical protein [Teredinibacter turnerae T7901]